MDTVLLKLSVDDYNALLRLTHKAAQEDVANIQLYSRLVAAVSKR